MGSFLSTNTTTAPTKEEEDKEESKGVILIAKVPTPQSTMLGWTYCLVYPEDDQYMSHLETGSMGILYRSSWSSLDEYRLEFLERPTVRQVMKTGLEKYRTERIKLTPLSEKEQENMKEVMKGEIDYI